MVSWGAVAVLLAVAVASAGWRSRPDLPAPPRARASSTHQQSMYEDAVRMVAGAELQRQDLPRRFAPVAVHNRGERDAESFLELCGSVVPSPERQLVADGRVYAAAGRRVRAVVVAYRPGGVERALAGLRSVPPSCAHPVPPRPVQQPATLAMRVRTGHPGHPSARRELVVLRRGDILSLLEVDGPSSSLPLELARVLGARLRASDG
jgi:hypothetical protein